MMKLKKYIFGVALGTLALTCASCYNADHEFPDFEGGTKAYFAYQNPVRTLVLGNTPMPQRYYTLLSSVIPYNGDARGYVEVQFNDEFFNDPDAIKNTYVIPLRMTGVSGIDAILSGTPIVSSPVRTNAQDWAVLPMDYVLYCVKYMNPWQGKYIRRGVDMVTENGGEPTKVVRKDFTLYNSDVEHYSKMDPSNPVNQNDEVCAITTKNRTEAIFPVSFKTSGASISCNLILKFNGDKCTIQGNRKGRI